MKENILEERIMVEKREFSYYLLRKYEADKDVLENLKFAVNCIQTIEFLCFKEDILWVDLQFIVRTLIIKYEIEEQKFRDNRLNDEIVNSLMEYQAFLEQNKNKEIQNEGLIEEGKEDKNVVYIRRRDITKKKAIYKLEDAGYKISKNVTFSSKNRSAYNYWANPVFDILSEDWNLILNDVGKSKFYLFQIPAGSISKKELVARSDKPNYIDLQIIYNDPTFTDGRSGLSFKKYFVGEFDYGENWL